VQNANGKWQNEDGELKIEEWKLQIGLRRSRCHPKSAFYHLPFAF
jgi:hypothetical protein